MYKLREIERSDLAILNKWRNDEELLSCLGSPFRYINTDTDITWYEQYLKNRGNTIRCAVIEDGGNNIPLGVVYLTNIDTTCRSAVSHIMIGRSENRRKGIGSFALKSILAHAFLNLNLNRIEALILEYNIPSIKLHTKLGYIQEGIKRQAAFKNGKYENVVLMAILYNNYKANLL